MVSGGRGAVPGIYILVAGAPNSRNGRVLGIAAFFICYIDRKGKNETIQSDFFVTVNVFESPLLGSELYDTISEDLHIWYHRARTQNGLSPCGFKLRKLMTHISKIRLGTNEFNFRNLQIKMFFKLRTWSWP